MIAAWCVVSSQFHSGTGSFQSRQSIVLYDPSRTGAIGPGWSRFIGQSHPFRACAPITYAQTVYNVLSLDYGQTAIVRRSDCHCTHHLPWASRRDRPELYEAIRLQTRDYVRNRVGPDKAVDQFVLVNLVKTDQFPRFTGISFPPVLG